MGIKISKKLFHIENGIATGNLKINKEITSRNYFIKASVHKKTMHCST